MIAPGHIELDTEKARADYLRAVGKCAFEQRRALEATSESLSAVLTTSVVYVAALEAEMAWNGTPAPGAPS